MHYLCTNAILMHKLQECSPQNNKIKLTKCEEQQARIKCYAHHIISLLVIIILFSIVMAHWSSVQDAELHKYYKNGTIYATNKYPQYLFEVTRNYFYSFLCKRRPDGDAAVAQLRLKNTWYLAGTKTEKKRKKKVIIICLLSFSQNQSCKVLLTFVIYVQKLIFIWKIFLKIAKATIILVKKKRWTKKRKKKTRRWLLSPRSQRQSLGQQLL